MNYLLPIAAAGGILSLLLPALLANLLPPRSPSHSPAGGPWCEGYYPDAEVCLELGPGQPSKHRLRRANALCPQWRIDPAWAAGSGRGALVSRLGQVEETALLWEGALADMEPEDLERCGGIDDGPNGGGTARPPVWLRRERGLAWSRLEEGEMAGNSEFHCDRDGDSDDGRGKEVRRSHVCWTDALLPLYIDKYGVRPSKEFEAFVLSFDLEHFRARLDILQECMSGGSDK